MLTNKEFQQFVLANESDPTTYATQLKGDKTAVSFLHSALGIASEGGEVADVMKKYLRNPSNPLPILDFADELGDVFHYVVMGLNALGMTVEQLGTLNEVKLETRQAIGKDKAVEKEVVRKLLAEWGLV